MLYPRIIEITTDKKTGETYVLVEFWKTKAARAKKSTPFLIEDFIMPLRPIGVRSIDPEDPELGSEEYDRDLRAEIQENIRAYVERAERFGYEGDNTSRAGPATAPFSVGGKVVRGDRVTIAEPRERDESDPHGVLKPEVTALRDKDIDVAVTP